MKNIVLKVFDRNAIPNSIILPILIDFLIVNARQKYCH